MKLSRLALVALVAGCADGTGEIDPDAVTNDARPAKRSEVIAVPDAATGTIVIYGGNDGPVVNQRSSAQFRKDTWVFEPGIGWTEVVSDTDPGKRGRYAAVNDGNGRMLIFGGRFRKKNTTGFYDLFNDVWAFDFADRTWTELDDGSGDAPDARYYPAGAWDASAGRFYIWGGATNQDPLIIEPSAELWSWSDDEGWLQHEVGGDEPSRRMFFGDTYDSKRNRLIVFGGQRGDFSSLAFHDLYALDLNDFTWERLHDGESSKAPSTRMHGAVQYDELRDRYLLFGGHTDLGDANDLWEFDPESKRWSVVYRGDKIVGQGFGCIGNESEVPADYVEQDVTAPERRHRGMHALFGDSLWIFGGMHAECSDHLDDTWRYDLATDAWVEIIEARTGESCLRRGDDCACLCL